MEGRTKGKRDRKLFDVTAVVGSVYESDFDTGNAAAKFATPTHAAMHMIADAGVAEGAVYTFPCENGGTVRISVEGE